MRRTPTDHRRNRGGVAMKTSDLDLLFEQQTTEPFFSTPINRRNFCKLLGGGVLVLVTTRPSDLLAQPSRPRYPEDPNAYLRIDENGRVTLFSGKIEMGQGINTSLSQMAAEALGVALDALEIVMSDTDLVPFDQG